MRVMRIFGGVTSPCAVQCIHNRLHRGRPCVPLYLQPDQCNVTPLDSIPIIPRSLVIEVSTFLVESGWKLIQKHFSIRI